MWRRTRLWLASLLRRRRFEQDLADELAFHLTARAEHWVAQGLPPAEARRRARLEFGSSAKATAETRDVRRGAWLEALLRDVRHAVRTLRRYPAFSAMAILSLAIGIGANAAIFGIARAVLFPDSPYAHPETLVNVYESEGGSGFNPVSHRNIEDLRRGTTDVFSGIAVSTFAVGTIDRGGTVGAVMGEAVTGGAFALLGIEPHLGRAIQSDDDVAPGGHPVVMLGYRYWQRAFDGDTGVIGRQLDMGGRSYTIIGVAPASYRGGLPAVTPAFFIPMAMYDELMGFESLDQRDFHSFFAIARLAPDVTQGQAEHAASLVAASLTRARPEGWVPGERFRFVPTTDVSVFPGADALFVAATWLLMAIVGLVLLLACTNLAGVLLARALDRGHEVAMRRALGATRGALARQLLVESGLLGLAGAAGGMVLAVLALTVLLSADLPLPYGLRLDLHLGLDRSLLLDWRVMALTVGIGALSGGLLGVVPAIQGTRADPAASLAAGGRGTETPGTLRWRSALVIAQVAISLVLLVGAGLFLRSWQQTLAVDPGFGREPTALLSVMIPVRQSRPEEARRRTRRLLDRFRATPGVDAASLAWPLPLDVSRSTTDFTVDGRVPSDDRESFRAEFAIVDGGFFDALGMAVEAGRTFDDGDRPDSPPVAIVSQAMARRYWPDGNALGRILRRPDPGEADLIVVGVASDINIRALGEAPRDVVYVPYTQTAGLPAFMIVARTTTDAAQLSQTLVVAGREADPELRVMQATTMAEHLALSRLPAQIGSFLLSSFAVMGLALAAVGVYGMVRYTVARRTREVGIRMALGADGRSVVRLLVRAGLRLALVGGAIGTAASLLGARLVAPLLYGVPSVDLVVLAGSIALFVGGAWLAAWLPARRAGRVDPLAAIRAE